MRSLDVWKRFQLKEMQRTALVPLSASEMIIQDLMLDREVSLHKTQDENFGELKKTSSGSGPE